MRLWTAAPPFCLRPRAVSDPEGKGREEGFSPQRPYNYGLISKRIGFVGQLLSQNEVIAIAAAISPYREEIGNFVEVYCKCPLEVCMERDGKGLYKKALAGEIKNFTGIDDPYEEPLNPEVILETDRETPEQSTSKVMEKLKILGYISFERVLYTSGVSYHSPTGKIKE